jgi:hypothetical protein
MHFTHLTFCPTTGPTNDMISLDDLIHAFSPALAHLTEETAPVALFCDLSAILLFNDKILISSPVHGSCATSRAPKCP